MNEPFKLDMWIEPAEANFTGAVPVFMEQTYKMAYDPRTFTLKPGTRQTVSATLLKSRSGLAEVVASATGWQDLFVSVDAGFSVG